MLLRDCGQFSPSCHDSISMHLALQALTAVTQLRMFKNKFASLFKFQELACLHWENLQGCFCSMKQFSLFNAVSISKYSFIRRLTIISVSVRLDIFSSIWKAAPLPMLAYTCWVQSFSVKGYKDAAICLCGFISSKLTPEIITLPFQLSKKNLRKSQCAWIILNSQNNAGVIFFFSTHNSSSTVWPWSMTHAPTNYHCINKWWFL